MDVNENVKGLEIPRDDVGSVSCRDKDRKCCFTADSCSVKHHFDYFTKKWIKTDKCCNTNA
ncbi:hypothetical protein AAHH67_31415 [Niallia circulans]